MAEFGLQVTDSSFNLDSFLSEGVIPEIDFQVEESFDEEAFFDAVFPSSPVLGLNPVESTYRLKYLNHGVIGKGKLSE
jgi:hypothetical protein